MKKEFDFSKEFGEINEIFVQNAGGKWKRKKCDIFRFYSRKIACIALFAILCIAAAGNSTVRAAVKEFTTKIGEAFGFAKDLSSYTEMINQTQTKNGISLTLKEVIADDRMLIVSVHVDAGREEETLAVWVNEGKTRIDGQKRMTYESIQADVGDIERSNDKVLAQIYEEPYFPEGDMKVHLVLEAEGQEGLVEMPMGEPNASVEGEAEFVYDFVVTPEELRSKTVKQKLDVTIGESGISDKSLTLTELAMNDLYGRIAATGVTWEDDWVNQYELKLKGTDSLGNPVSFEGVTFLSEQELLFTTNFLGDYEEGAAIDEDEFCLSIPDKDCEYLDLQLYERDIFWGEVWGEEEDLNGEEELFAQESAGENENYLEEENYGWKPVGEPFRISIQRERGMTGHED